MELFSILIGLVFGFSAYDSYLSIYKEGEFYPHKYSEIANSTWKEFFISENVTNLIKCIPYYIDSDKELDLLVLDSESRLYWVSNIRGTSKEVKHQFISSSKLHDFVISDRINYNNHLNDDNFYILGINSMRNKILKFKFYQNKQNLTSFWKETEFLDINNDENLMIKSFIKNSEIVSVHLSQYENDPNKQLLLVGLQNYDDYTTNLLKIIIFKEEINNVALIKFRNKVKVVGTCDMNNDGLIDILYVDGKDNLYIMINDDPYYWHILVGTINTVHIRNTPRIFILDNDNDNYPDIVVAEKTENIVGLIFNNGASYWSKVKKYYQKSQNRDEVYIDDPWKFIPLIDPYEENLYQGAIKDFTVFKITSKRRINFEIFTIYDNNLFWFVEKELNVPESVYSGPHKMVQNYMYSMTKCHIVIEQQGDDSSIDYKFILDIDINNDYYPEFILYSSRDSSLYWIKKYVPDLTGLGWTSDFWIYLIIYIYIVSSFVGMYEFYGLKQLNDEIATQKLLKGNDINKNFDSNFMF